MLLSDRVEFSEEVGSLLNNEFSEEVLFSFDTVVDELISFYVLFLEFVVLSIDTSLLDDVPFTFELVKLFDISFPAGSF